MKKIWSLLCEYKKYTIYCFVLTVLQVICYLEIPLLVAKVLNECIIQQDKSKIIEVGIQMLAFTILAMLFGILCSYTATKASQGFGANARKILFKKVLKLSAKNVDAFTSASLITRLNSDISALQNSFYVLGYQLIYAILMVAFALLYLIRINGKLALIVGITVLLFLICISIILALGLPKFGRLQKETERLNQIIQENMIAQRVVKSFGRQQTEQEKLAHSNNSLTKILTSAFGSFLLMFPFSSLLMYVGIIGLLWVGGKMTGQNGVIGFGDLSSSLSYSFQIFGSLITLSTALPQIGKAIVSVKRLFHVIETEPAVKNQKNGKLFEEGHIKFEHVTFNYLENNNGPIISDIDLSIPPAQFLAVIGSTGEGKSTLLKLLLRLYDPVKGNIFINNINIKDYSLASLRENIGVVSQDNMLFSATIRDNIKLGKPGASDAEIIAVCKDAEAHDFIMKMPKGYDTWIEQGGTNISGGQRQRLCIARALLKKPSIFIFDDCMSALDSVTEHKIQKVIRQKYYNSTVIMIAQKISSIKSADRIIVLDGGTINGSGAHEDLLTGNTVYQQIYASQTQGGIVHECI